MPVSSMLHKTKKSLFAIFLLVAFVALPSVLEANFTTLHNFSLYGDIGLHPYTSLIQSGNVLYGTTTVGGIWGFGTVFSVNTDGTGYTTLHSFNDSDGSDPFSSVTL